MSPINSVRVVEALDVLCNAPSELLLSYKGKLRALLRKLNPPSIPVEQLMQALQDSEKVKEPLSKLRVEDIVAGAAWEEADRRIVDFQLATGSPGSAQEKLRRVLSQRSLAQEFNDWDSKNHFQVSKGETRQGGRKRTFISANAHRFRNSDAASKGIGLGQKLLVFEEFLGVGFSALFIFCHKKFEEVASKQLNELKYAIDKQHEDAISNNQESIKDLAEQKTTWLRECQEAYEGK